MVAPNNDTLYSTAWFDLRAGGILMERERITGEQAFEVLRRASQHLNVKLREVAAALVETGETPDTGKGAPAPG